MWKSPEMAERQNELTWESLCGSDVRAAPEHGAATQAVSNAPCLQAGPQGFLYLSKSETDMRRVCS